MSLKDTVQSVADNLQAAYAAVQEKGGELPEHKNLQNLSEAILSISGGGGKGNLGKLLALFRSNPEECYKQYPVGTEFADTWNGEDAPLILVSYKQVRKLDGTWVDGITMQRRFASSNAVPWSQPTVGSVETSSMPIYLNGEYFEKCSDMVKSCLCEVMAPCSSRSGNASITGYVDSKWFLPVLPNVMGAVQQLPWGQWWEYWYQRTGLTNGSTNPNTGRVARMATGEAVNWWLYSAEYGSNYTRWFAVNTSGAMGTGSGYAYDTNHILPAFSMY